MAATATKSKKKHSYGNLTAEQIELFGEEMDALRQRVIADLGERDADYIRKIIKAQRGLEVAGRGTAASAASSRRPGSPAPSTLGVSKILDNMEIGHNVMHGQYDWMQRPGAGRHATSSGTPPARPTSGGTRTTTCTTRYTNIVGKDRDIGYGILRMSEDQPWNPYYLGNPVYAFLLMMLFQYGVALHDLEVERIAHRRESRGRQARAARRASGRRSASRR